MNEEINSCPLYKGAKITKASHFDYEYVLGHKIVFLCVAKVTISL